MPILKRDLAAATLGLLGHVASVWPLPAQATARHEKPRAIIGRPIAPAERPATLDPADVISDQMRRERRRDMTSLLSRAFKAAYDGVPRDEDNLGLTILGNGYDVPDRVVRVTSLSYDDATRARRASATAKLHYNNPDALVPSFERSIAVSFVMESGHWKIDDVRMYAPRGGSLHPQVGMKRAFELLSKARRGATSTHPSSAVDTNSGVSHSR